MTTTQQRFNQRVPTVTGEPGSPPVIVADDSLPHQIRLIADYATGTAQIVVTCTCLGRQYGPGAGRGHERKGIIEARPAAFPAREAVAAYRQWHIDRGELVRP